MKKLLFLATLLLAACRKDDPAPAGDNTFSCQIDGKDFTPYISDASQPFVGPKIKALESMYDRSRRILVIEGKTIDYQISFGVRSPTQAASFQLGYTRAPYPYSLNPDNYGYCVVIPNQTDPYNPTPNINYYTDRTNTGTITFARFDTVARVAVGTFDYTAREAATGKLVRVTNGQFNVKF